MPGKPLTQLILKPYCHQLIQGNGVAVQDVYYGKKKHPAMRFKQKGAVLHCRGFHPQHPQRNASMMLLGGIFTFLP